MPQIDVDPLFIPDRMALAEAVFALNDRGWTGALAYRRQGQGTEPEYYANLEKANQTALIKIGDELRSIGGGIVMTIAEYEATFGSGG